MNLSPFFLLRFSFQTRAEDVVPARMRDIIAAIKARDFETFAKITMMDSNQVAENKQNTASSSGFMLTLVFLAVSAASGVAVFRTFCLDIGFRNVAQSDATSLGTYLFQPVFPLSPYSQFLLPPHWIEMHMYLDTYAFLLCFPSPILFSSLSSAVLDRHVLTRVHYCVFPYSILFNPFFSHIGFTVSTLVPFRTLSARPSSTLHLRLPLPSPSPSLSLLPPYLTRIHYRVYPYSTLFLTAHSSATLTLTLIPDTYQASASTLVHFRVSSTRSNVHVLTYRPPSLLHLLPSPPVYLLIASSTRHVWTRIRPSST